MGRYKFDIFFLFLRVFDRREILAENHAGKTGERVRPVNTVCMMGFYNFIMRVSIRSRSVILLLLEKTPLIMISLQMKR